MAATNLFTPQPLTKSAASSLSWKKPIAPAFSLSMKRRLAAAQPRRFVVLAMENSKPTILVAEKLGEAGVKLLKEFANVDCSYNAQKFELTPSGNATKFTPRD
uniref:Uncharacterized protein n=1 Tax=Kalanchoe fedtschenkoi TaxID=63787 RepID=A0A7N0R8S5_KALFE